MKWLRSIKREYVILACMIAVQVIYLTCMFAANKQGFHSDELWEYGIGNALSLWINGLCGTDLHLI